MPFTAPVLNIGQGLADGIMSGANALSSAIDYVRDQYKSSKSAQGAMTALSNMKDGNGSPMVSPQMLDMFNKMTPQQQVGAAGVFSGRAQNLWDSQNKISVAQASSTAQGTQERQTNAAQFQNYRNAWSTGSPMSGDVNKANAPGVVGGNAPVATPPPQKNAAPTTYQMPLNPSGKGAQSGFYSFQVDPATGKPIPGTMNFGGTSAIPNVPLFNAK